MMRDDLCEASRGSRITPKPKLLTERRFRQDLPEHAAIRGSGLTSNTGTKSERKENERLNIKAKPTRNRTLKGQNPRPQSSLHISSSQCFGCGFFFFD